MNLRVMMAALLAMPTKPLNENNLNAWTRGEGWGAAKPRAAKHTRKGVYTESETRKARRRLQLERAR